MIPGTKHPNTADGWAAVAEEAHRYPRDLCIAILAWNDPDGVFTDEQCRAEGYAPLTLHEARELLESVARSV